MLALVSPRDLRRVGVQAATEEPAAGRGTGARVAARHAGRARGGACADRRDDRGAGAASSSSRSSSSGATAAVGVVIAVKTLARFKQLDDRGFAEYYLLGTLASVSVAIGSAYLALAAFSSL